MAAPQEPEIVPLECDNGQSYDVRVNGAGEFTPGHVVGSQQVAKVFALEFETVGAAQHPHRVDGNTTPREVEVSARA